MVKKVPLELSLRIRGFFSDFIFKVKFSGAYPIMPFDKEKNPVRRKISEIWLISGKLLNFIGVFLLLRFSHARKMIFDMIPYSTPQKLY